MKTAANCRACKYGTASEREDLAAELELCAEGWSDLQGLVL